MAASKVLAGCAGAAYRFRKFAFDDLISGCRSYYYYYFIMVIVLFSADNKSIKIMYIVKNHYS